MACNNHKEAIISKVNIQRPLEDRPNRKPKITMKSEEYGSRKGKQMRQYERWSRVEPDGEDKRLV